MQGSTEFSRSSLAVERLIFKQIEFLRKKSVIVVLLLALVVEAALLLRPLPVRSLDCRLYYFPSEIQGILASFGEIGRRSYWVNEWIDLTFIATYSALLLGLLSRRLSGAKLFLFALAPGFFDFFETTGVLTHLLSYPTSLHGVEIMISVCTPLKWLFWAVALGVGTWDKWNPSQSR